MNNNFIFGQYRPSDSLMHRLDPRAKLLIALFLMILALFTESALFYGAMIFLLAILLRLSNIHVRQMASNIGPFIILISLTALYHLIFSSRDSAEIISIFGFVITRGGLEMAISFSLRVILFVLIAFIVALTISPSDMGESLVVILSPLRKLKVPVNDIGLILFIAMRFIPVLAEEFDTIKKAQIIRGVDFSGNLIKRSKKTLSLLVPVFYSAIRRADDLALAIESRGYISGAERSSLTEFRFTSREWLFIFVSICASSLIYISLGR